MKSKLFILIAIFSIGCSGKKLEVPNAQQKETVFEDYFTSKKPTLFEHYYMFQQYSNYQMPILSHEKVIDLVAKAHNVSSNDFYEVYKKEYEAFYKERIKKEVKQ